MRWLNRLSALLFGLVSIGAARDFFSKYQVVLVDKEDIMLEENNESSLSPMDLRGTPTHVCLCGSQIWNIKAIFDNYEIATYFLEMECINCGSIATAPTPIDRERME